MRSSSAYTAANADAGLRGGNKFSFGDQPPAGMNRLSNAMTSYVSGHSSGSAVNEAVMGDVVKDMWSQYDVDGNGILDKEEAKKFLQTSLLAMSGTVGGKAGQVSDEAFMHVFRLIDTDHSGGIDRNEMQTLMSKLLKGESLATMGGR